MKNTGIKTKQSFNTKAMDLFMNRNGCPVTPGSTGVRAARFETAQLSNSCYTVNAGAVFFIKMAIQVRPGTTAIGNCKAGNIFYSKRTVRWEMQLLFAA